MKLALLNTTIATADGIYEVETIGFETAKRLVASNELDSAIGHQSTADVMTTLLETEVVLNRQEFYQEKGQQALVFKLNGRPPEGVILSKAQIAKMGYSFKLMTRTA
jgi:hypothetical protein